MKILIGIYYVDLWKDYFFGLVELKHLVLCR